MKINLHSHTQFCDARNTMEEILNAAHAAGFTTWGFSPHGPVCVPSPCNMKIEDVPAYLKEIERLRLLFPDMKILAGMEVDFINEDNGPASHEVRDYGLDYVIGSVHFIPNQKGEYIDIDGSPERFKKNLQDKFGGDLKYVVATYWHQVQKMIKQGGLDIIGHIDKISLNASSVDPKIEHSDLYSRLANETIDLAIKSGLEVEINTKHYKKYGRFFPHPRYWKKFLDSGIKLPVNTDTHFASLVGDGMDEAYLKLKELS